MEVLSKAVLEADQMNAIIKVSRDSESFRIELQDEGDASALRKLGPYSMIQKGDCILCHQDPSGIGVAEMTQGTYGLRFFDEANAGSCGGYLETWPFWTD